MLLRHLAMSIDSPLVDWEKKAWACAYCARRALTVALTAMIGDNEMSRERALEIARAVLHDDVAQPYGFTP